MVSDHWDPVKQKFYCTVIMYFGCSHLCCFFNSVQVF